MSTGELIADTGVTGGLGGRVARRLAERGVAQRLVARDPGRAPALASVAALTMIEEINHLSPDTLQAAYQQAQDWLADSQSLDVLSRLNAAAGKLAASMRRELSRDEAVEILLARPHDLDQKLLEYEHELIKQALIQSDGKITHAAKLLGRTYQGLAHMIETKHPDLIPLRTPVRRRPRRTGKRKK